jgi:hypothetical protein
MTLLFLLSLSGVGGLLFVSPAFAQTLALNVSSPSPGAVFDRGETVTITTTVTDGGSPVSGATVTANSPTGATITLAETVAGTYSASYQVASTDPVGTWAIDLVATSGGQTASAQLSVSISDSLVVSFEAPPALTTFNVGQAAVVDSKVTYQDGTAVPSTASVTFTDPSGTAVPMTVDAADSSGMTWTGSYTITGADVPAQGTDWPIVTAASVGGDSGTATEDVALFSSLLVTASTYGNSAYTTPQDSFVVGQTVFVEAAVALHDGVDVSSGSVSFEISGTGVASTPVPMTFSTALGAWTGSYTTASSDTLGAQTVSVSAADGLGNTGSGSEVIALQSTSQGLAVSITSPAAGSTLNRGETATITALVTSGGSPLSGAAVTASTPSGGTITLTNTAGGTYSGSYTVTSTDPAGTWTITVQAVQGGQLAAAQDSVTISSALRVAVSTYSSPAYTTPQSSFDAGQTIYVKAVVSLQDGAAVTAGAVSFELTGSSIASVPVSMTYDPSLGAWTGTYTVLSTDQTGNQVVTVAASDLHGNSGTGTLTVGIATPVTTTGQGLEASITFDPATDGIVVTADCGSGCVAPTSVTVTNATQGNGQGHGHGWAGIFTGAFWNDGGRGCGHGRCGRGHVREGAPYGERVYTISDSAGHTLTLTVSVRDDGHQVVADVLGIQYGSGPTIHPARDQLDFQYSQAKGGSLQSLQETALANATVGLAHYSERSGNTTIAIGSWERGGSGRVAVTESGLWLLELTTSNGALTVGYVESS